MNNGDIKKNTDLENKFKVNDIESMKKVGTS